MLGAIAACIAGQGGAAAPSPWASWNGSLDGSPAVFRSTNAITTSLTMLSASLAIVTWEDAGVSDTGFACAASISGTTVTFGTAVEFSAAKTISNNSVAALSATEAIVCYRDTGDSNKGKAVILDVSGTTITVNSIVTFESDAIAAVSVTALSSSKAVVVWNDSTAAMGKSMVLDVASSAITTNTAFVFASSNTAVNCVVAMVSSSRVLVVYSDSNNSGFGTAQALDISSSTVTGNTTYVFNSSASSLFRIAAITSSTYAIVYKNAGDSNFSNAQVLSLAGTVVSNGSPVRVINVVPSDGFFTICKADSQSAFVFYRDVTTSRGAAKIGTISGTAISFGSPVALTSSHTAQAMAATQLDSTHVLSVYRDQSNSNAGTGKVSAAA